MTSRHGGEIALETPVLKRSIIAGSIGVLVHWFDWAIYAYMATTIAAVFFPAQDSTAGLLSVFAVFAVSFAIRPLGSLVFGPLGDKIGRRKTLSVVILLMAGATLMVGLLPTYASIGVLAPVLLVVARLVQGLAAGGEFGSAAAFLAEYSPRKHRGFGVSWLEFGSLLGFLAASLTVYLLSLGLSDDAIRAWGWRIPFLLSAPLGIIGFYIRSKIEDTPEFRVLEETKNVSKNPMKELFTRNWKPLVQMSGIEVMMHVTFYVVLVYLLTYQARQLDVSSGDAALASTITSIVAVALVPLVGALSDRIGRKPLLIGSGVGLIALSFPLFQLMREGGLVNLVLAQVGLGVLLAVILGTHAVAVSEIFPTRVRQGGLSIGYNFTAAVFAGTVPYLMTYLIDETGNELVPAFYLMLVGAVGVLATLTMRETVGTTLLDAQDVATADLPSTQTSTAPADKV